nr:putative reverse transcriptase domain-containing protein [Tanacetum cinerariifolium]
MFIPVSSEATLVTRKSDVYAFGVVLLETLCCSPALNLVLDEQQHSLAGWAKHYIKDGDKVKLKISSWKEVIRFCKRGKLNLRYTGPFNVLAKVGTVAYKLKLLQQLSKVHSTFHVSNLKKCLSDESLVIPMDEIQIDNKLHFVDEPMEILDQEVKQLKQSRIPIVKI